jgi:hypothetical protein
MGSSARRPTGVPTAVAPWPRSEAGRLGRPRHCIVSLTHAGSAQLWSGEARAAYEAQKSDLYGADAFGLVV